MVCGVVTAVVTGVGAPPLPLLALWVAATFTSGATDMLTLLATVPPGPVQVRVNVRVSVRAPVESDPLVPLAPLQAPLAWQEFVLVELQRNVVAPPKTTFN